MNAHTRLAQHVNYDVILALRYGNPPHPLPSTMVGTLLATLKSWLIAVYYFFIDLVHGNKCTLKNCGCDFYDDTETFQQLSRQANDPQYAARMIDAGVVGRPLNCDRCAHPREMHERLAPRRMMPEFMPNGGVVAIELVARNARKKRAARFPDKLVKREAVEVKVTDVREGDGNVVVHDTEVLCQYEAKFASDEAVFESNDEFRFKVGAAAVIPGLDEGIRGMKVGGERRIAVPPQLAYGMEKVIDGRKGETLVFAVRLLAAVQA